MMRQIGSIEVERCRWQKKRGRNGAAVKIQRLLKKPHGFWEPQESRGARMPFPHKQKNNLIFTRRWRNWQTRWIQVPVVAILCGFKSHPPHQKSRMHQRSGFFTFHYSLSHRPYSRDFWQVIGFVFYCSSLSNVFCRVAVA